MRMDTIKHGLARLERRLGQVALAGLPGSLSEFARSGVEPADATARAYLATLRAFDRVVDLSVGGLEGDYTKAVSTYTVAVRDYRVSLQDAGVRA